MRDKIYSITLAVIFVALMIGCPLAVGLAELDIIKLPENKNIKFPEKVYEDEQILAPLLNSIERGKASLENIYSNGLPMYENIIRFMLDNERSMREFLLDSLYNFEKVKPKPDITALEIEDIPKIISDYGEESEYENSLENPADDEVTESEKPEYQAKYIGTDGDNKVWAFTEVDKPYSEGWTDRTLIASEDELRQRMNVQVNHVNRIANANLNVNFYVYVCTRFQETEVFGEIISDIRTMRDEKSTKHFMDEFFAGLDMTAVNAYDCFKIDTLEKRLEYIYKTDHHESARGAYSIYCDVINMIAEDTPEIGELREVEFGLFDEIELRGSHVWSHGYTEIYDDFEYYIVDLPEHIMYEDIEKTKESQRNYDNYIAGNFKKDTFAGHYANYYPRPANVEYYDNNTGRNLLMLTDSYSWATGELIASHFDKTYATLWAHGEFDYNEFIRENNITDVLIMQVAERLLYNIYDKTQLEKVITD